MISNDFAIDLGIARVESAHKEKIGTLGENVSKTCNESKTQTFSTKQITAIIPILVEINSI